MLCWGGAGILPPLQGEHHPHCMISQFPPCLSHSSWGLAFGAPSAEPQCCFSGRHDPGGRVPSVLEASSAQLRLPCPPQHVLLGLGFQELSWDHTSPEEEEAALWLEFDGDSEGTPVNKLLKIYSKQVGSVYSCSLPPRLPLPCGSFHHATDPW